MKNVHLLNQVTDNLRKLFLTVDHIIPVEILPSTIRTMEQQKDYFARGVSKTMDSTHLIIPGVRELSEAVDAGPYPFSWPKEGSKDYWKDWGRLYYFAGVVIAVAHDLKIPIRYGGDWDGDFDLKDQNFYDGVHFEELTNAIKT